MDGCFVSLIFQLEPQHLSLGFYYSCSKVNLVLSIDSYLHDTSASPNYKNIKPIIKIKKKRTWKQKMSFEGSVCLNNIKASVFYLASVVRTYTPIYRYSKGNSSRHISFLYFPSKLMLSQAHYQRTVFFQHQVSKIYNKGKSL